MPITVEQVALLWFGEVGEHGSASSNCQKIRRLIPDVLPARRIGNRPRRRRGRGAGHAHDGRGS
jgi:hypothetical protein